jgi:hypothetical protein
MSDVMINVNVTASGQIISAFCVPAVDTILNGSAVQGDLHGVWPYLFINAQPDITAGTYDLGIYEMTLNAAGILTALTPTGASFVQVGSAVSSETNTIDGTYGVSLDLVQVLPSPVTVGSGNQIPVVTFNIYGQATAAVEGNTAIVVGQAIASSTLTGSYGSTINLVTQGGLTPGTYGSSTLVTVSVNGFGVITGISNSGTPVLLNNTAIYSNSGTLTGFIPGSLDLVAQGAITPGTYGSPHVPLITVNGYGITTAISNGFIAIANNTAIYSNSGTLVGHIPGTLDLVTQGSLAVGTYGSPYVPIITVNAYGVTTALSNGIIAIANNTAIYSNSGTITGSIPGSLDLPVQGSLTPGSYGNQQTVTVTVNAYGLATSISNGVTVIANNTAIYSNTGTIHGSIPGSLDLPVQSGVLPGNYGQNSTCFLAAGINAYGIVTSTGCFSISGLGNGSSVFSIFLGTPNEVIVTQVLLLLVSDPHAHAFRSTTFRCSSRRPSPLPRRRVSRLRVSPWVRPRPIPLPCLEPANNSFRSAHSRQGKSPWASLAVSPLSARSRGLPIKLPSSLPRVSSPSVS